MIKINSIKKANKSKTKKDLFKSMKCKNCSSITNKIKTVKNNSKPKIISKSINTLNNNIFKNIFNTKQSYINLSKHTTKKNNLFLNKKRSTNDKLLLNKHYNKKSKIKLISNKNIKQENNNDDIISTLDSIIDINIKKYIQKNSNLIPKKLHYYNRNNN